MEYYACGKRKYLEIKLARTNPCQAHLCQSVKFLLAKPIAKE